MVDYINKNINSCNRYGSPNMFSGTVFLGSISESVEYPMELLKKYRDNYVALTRIINNFLTILQGIALVVAGIAILMRWLDCSFSSSRSSYSSIYYTELG